MLLLVHFMLNGLRLGTTGPMRALPVAERTGIQMYELRARIIADTAISEFERGLTDRFRMDPGNPHIDRLPLHMQAVLGRPSA
jgi:hypothetical protein